MITDNVVRKTIFDGQENGMLMMVIASASTAPTQHRNIICFNSLSYCDRLLGCGQRRGLKRVQSERRNFGIGFGRG
ncbi:MAG: hypothetical protein VKL42_14990 [Snowella sp.]|nr:hypothetical protein [Snowella sp.]